MNPAVPLVLDSPHSGHDFPADFDAIVGEAELRESEDCYVDELYAAAHELGAPLLAASFPRTYIDPNRHAGDVDLELIDGAWPWDYQPSGKARIGKSLVWRTLEDGRPIYAHKLPPEVVRGRIQRFHTPYHRSLKSLLDKTHQKFGRVYHINCHSMRAVAGKQSDEGEGAVRADFVLGDRDGTTCAPEFTALVAAKLRSMGYAVAVNDPYKGVELVRKHGRPAEKRNSLQIEIKRTLYMNEETLAPNAGYAKLEIDLARMLAAVRDHIKAAIGQAT